eukprot:16451749-Heterocapsa_arctica.AAC.1
MAKREQGRSRAAAASAMMKDLTSPTSGGDNLHKNGAGAEQHFLGKLQLKRRRFMHPAPALSGAKEAGPRPFHKGAPA